MPVVYRFRVTFEDYDEVSRDIEIKSTLTFLDLHQTIQTSIGFDNSKPASFYMSNDNWIKGQEISTEVRKDKAGNTSVLMRTPVFVISLPIHIRKYYTSVTTMPTGVFSLSL